MTTEHHDNLTLTDIIQVRRHCPNSILTPSPQERFVCPFIGEETKAQDVKALAQGHTACECGARILSLGSLALDAP